jgi:hypothetical protein
LVGHFLFATSGQGFQYLYLTEADYKSLPSGAVIGKLVPGVGYALDAVVGQGLSSLVQGDGESSTVITTRYTKS